MVAMGMNLRASRFPSLCIMMDVFLGMASEVVVHVLSIGDDSLDLTTTMIFKPVKNIKDFFRLSV